MGERISDEIIAHCHQCGALYDSHTNCKKMMAATCFFIQCPVCAEKYKGCCSEICCEESTLPPEEQSDAVGQDVKMAIRSLISLVDV